ncbi:Cytochrome c [Roseomonas mucosa]|uniref:c-type cytochrome n=1 Tax=Roseomonas mucosa TaxID=207340 RepID=UPI00220A69FE|nr:cytochrome c [Roseomonas mucosa]QDJ09451.1 Cytochrome c [Roseomonas mucosa]
MRPLLHTLAGLAVAAVAGALPARAEPDRYDQVERGRYLAIVGDCTACHAGSGIAPGMPGYGSRGFAGGRPIETPFGQIRAANITPDRETGIGTWTAEDFYRALHEGHAADGTLLYPAFPYTYYTKVTREDSDAIFAFLQSLEAVQNPVDRNTLPFPFSIRLLMKGWNLLFFRPGAFEPVIGRSAEWNRGAYLVEGLGHCGACHTPKNMLGGDKTSQALGGGELQGWFAPSLTTDNRTGIGGWSVEEIVEYLRTGHNVHGAASGPMAEVVEYSTMLMTEADLRAIATYLKQPREEPATVAAPAPLPAGNAQMQVGAAIYMDGCRACHGPDGKGVAGLFPALANSPAVQQAGPETLLRVVMQGSKPATTAAVPTAASMPAFGWRLTDDQAAAVTTYIRNSWGNAASAVTVSQAQSMRDRLAQNPN